MIIEKVLGNLHELPDPEAYAGLHQEKVVLPSAQLVKRIQRVTTDHGKEIGIRLPAGSGDLRDGDILHVEDSNMIVVSVLPTDVLVIAPRTIHEMGVTAHSLGNRHLQAQFFDAILRVRGRTSWCAPTTTPSRTTSATTRCPTPARNASCLYLSAMLSTRTSRFVAALRAPSEVPLGCAAPDWGPCPLRGARHAAAPIPRVALLRHLGRQSVSLTSWPCSS